MTKLQKDPFIILLESMDSKMQITVDDRENLRAHQDSIYKLWHINGVGGCWA
jgi:hypothetical protein